MLDTGRPASDDAPRSSRLGDPPARPPADAPTGAASILRASKAETLAALRERCAAATVPDLVHFSVRDWRRQRAEVLHDVLVRLGGPTLAVRSSARDEDRPGRSRAGHYRSHLDVARDPGALCRAVDDVIASFDGHPDDRVLVQEMARDVTASGVLLTRDLACGGPYYVFEYDDGAATDTVTGGTGMPKRLVVHRDAELGPLDARGRRLLGLARRVEHLARCRALEIELAERRDGTIAVLQVRALRHGPTGTHELDRTVHGILTGVAGELAERARPRPGLAGTSAILGQMPDWNPAELIGSFPAPLSASLFQYLIGDDVWQRARATMGYRTVPGQPLVVILAGRPWVDVRASFNSYLPSGLDHGTETALVDAWLARLRDHPELHDKVELEVAQTARDFTFAEACAARLDGALPPRARARWADALGALTARNVSLARDASLVRALATVERLGRTAIVRPGSQAVLPVALRVLDACRDLGTLPFAIVARHAFIAEALLRSAVARGALAPERRDALRAACTTVAGRLARDFVAAVTGRAPRADFLARYGHLRPGSFDVTSRRYDARPELFDDVHIDRSLLDRRAGSFVLAPREARALGVLSREAGLHADGAALVAYATSAIAGRERAKLLFTRHLSAALEHLAAWAARRGLSRDDLSQLTVADLRDAGDPATREASAALRARIAQRRTQRSAERAVRLGTLLRDARDLYVLPDEPCRPTFVTARVASGAPLVLDGRAAGRDALEGRMVCIASADPGFDWIFAYRIAGLVTCFGGGNSHMAIRCFELGIPAAIGVGEATFDRLCRAPLVELRCHDRLVRCVASAASV